MRTISKRLQENRRLAGQYFPSPSAKTVPAVLERDMRKGEETRTCILDVAETAVLQKGFGGTSIEELIAETGITKSGFLNALSAGAARLNGLAAGIFHLRRKRSQLPHRVESARCRLYQRR